MRGFSHSLRMEHDYEVLELSVRQSSGDEILRAVRHPTRPVVSPLWGREPAHVQVLRPVRHGPDCSPPPGLTLLATQRSFSPPEAQRQGYTPPHLAEKILRSRSALEGERRQVTVLFADMAGFTTLAEQLDPEVHQIIDRCFELITAEVHRFEGTINQYTGDGVMALFGAPVAHEDSPRRRCTPRWACSARYGHTVRSCRRSAAWPCRCAWGSTLAW